MRPRHTHGHCIEDASVGARHERFGNSFSQRRSRWPGVDASSPLPVIYFPLNIGWMSGGTVKSLNGAQPRQGRFSHIRRRQAPARSRHTIQTGSECGSACGLKSVPRLVVAGVAGQVVPTVPDVGSCQPRSQLSDDCALLRVARATAGCAPGNGTTAVRGIGLPDQADSAVRHHRGMERIQVDQATARTKSSSAF